MSDANNTKDSSIEGFDQTDQSFFDRFEGLTDSDQFESISSEEPDDALLTALASYLAGDSSSSEEKSDAEDDEENNCMSSFSTDLLKAMEQHNRNDKGIRNYVDAAMEQFDTEDYFAALESINQSKDQGVNIYLSALQVLCQARTGNDEHIVNYLKFREEFLVSAWDADTSIVIVDYLLLINERTELSQVLDEMASANFSIDLLSYIKAHIELSDGMQNKALERLRHATRICNNAIHSSLELVRILIASGDYNAAESLIYDYIFPAMVASDERVRNRAIYFKLLIDEHSLFVDRKKKSTHGLWGQEIEALCRLYRELYVNTDRYIKEINLELINHLSALIVLRSESDFLRNVAFFDDDDAEDDDALPFA